MRTSVVLQRAVAVVWERNTYGPVPGAYFAWRPNRRARCDCKLPLPQKAMASQSAKVSKSRPN